MTKEQSTLVASELKNVGFDTLVKKNGSVLVTLHSRSISTMEVDTALHQIFSGIFFQLTHETQTKGVLVSY